MASTPYRAFHRTDDKYEDSIIRSLEIGIKSGKITPDDASLIREFVSEVSATSHISASRKYKITYILIGWRRFIGPFHENGIGDIYAGVDKVRTARKDNGDPLFKQNTIADYVRFIKRLYLWMIENDYSSATEKKVRRIKPPAYDAATKSVEMLLEPKEVRRMIDACFTSRDRAIVAMLYEGGFRAGEIGELVWKQVKFTDWNVAINTDFKTGKGRYVPLVMAREYLAQWRNDYPLQPTPDNPVFLNHNKQSLQYQGLNKQLKTIASRAGVEKHITPHIFRHSRITHLIQEGYKESVIKLMMWGHLETDMFSVYAHLTSTDIDDEVAAQNGIKPPAAKEKAECLGPRQCMRCYSVNPPTHEFCSKCGLPLTEEAARSIEAAKKAIVEDQDTMKETYNQIYDYNPETVQP